MPQSRITSNQKKVKEKMNPNQKRIATVVVAREKEEDSERKVKRMDYIHLCVIKQNTMVYI